MGGQSQDPSPVCCFQFLQGTKCTFGEGCRYVHAAQYVGALTSAHSGEVKSLGRDNTVIYSVGDDSAIKTFSYGPGTGITSTGSHPLRGNGTFFVCSEPTKQFYFTAYTSPLFPTSGGPDSHALTGQVQMTVGPTTLDLLISPDKPYADRERVNAIAAWEVTDASTGATMPHVFTGGEDGVIRVWNVDSATSQFAVTGSMEGHTRGVTALVIITGADTSPFLWSSSNDGTVRVWNPQTYALQCIIAAGGLYNPADRSLMQACSEIQTGPMTDMVKMEYNGDTYLAVGSKDGTVCIYTTQGNWTGRTAPLKPLTDIDGGGVTHLAVAYKGADQLLLAAHDSGHLVMWTLPTLDLYCMIDPRNIGRPSPPSQGYQNQTAPVLTQVTALMSLDNEIFLTGTNDGTVRCWSIV